MLGTLEGVPVPHAVSQEHCSIRKPATCAGSPFFSVRVASILSVQARNPADFEAKYNRENLRPNCWLLLKQNVSVFTDILEMRMPRIKKKLNGPVFHLPSCQPDKRKGVVLTLKWCKPQKKKGS